MLFFRRKKKPEAVEDEPTAEAASAALDAHPEATSQADDVLASPGDAPGDGEAAPERRPDAVADPAADPAEARSV